MTGPLRNKASLWRDRGKGAKSRFSELVKDPVVERPDVPTITTKRKIDRGGTIQSLRLKHYPSIDVDLDHVYAGSFEGSLDDAETALFQLGFRNGPLAYVEVTDEFGPDDGSYWLHIISEIGKFPLVDNRAGVFRRIKDQIHVVAWVEEDSDVVHFGAHREQSAPLQPARHVLVSDANARRGIRDFRNRWFDVFGEELPRPLG